MTEKTEALIAEIRALAAEVHDYSTRGAEAMNEAADALGAVTEQFEKAEHDRLYWRRRFQTMHKRAKRAEAERDAALAAVERCRGVLSAWESRQERNREILGSGGLGHFKAIDCTDDLRAALDGAPEPDTITIPRPVVPYGPEHKTENAATSDYLLEVVKKIDGKYCTVGGSNLTATVRKLLTDAADAVRGLPVEGEKP